jgi:hypothetical protein
MAGAVRRTSVAACNLPQRPPEHMSAQRILTVWADMFKLVWLLQG